MLSLEGKLTDIGKWYLAGDDHSNGPAPKSTAPLVIPTVVLVLSIAFLTCIFFYA